MPLHQIAPLVVHAIKFGGGYVAAAERAIASQLYAFDLLRRSGSADQVLLCCCSGWPALPPPLPLAASAGPRGALRSVRGRAGSCGSPPPDQHDGRRPRRQRRPHPRRARARPRRPGCDLAVFPELADHRLPARGPAAQAGLRGRQPRGARQGRRRAPAGARPSSASSTPAATSTTRRPCAPAARCVGIYRKRVLPNYAVFDEQRYFAPGHRAAPALRHRRRAGRRVDLRGRLEPDGPDRRPGRRRRRADRQPQRVAVLRRASWPSGSGCSPPGPPTRRARSSTSTRSAARTSWSSTARSMVFDADGELIARGPAVRRGPAGRRPRRRARSTASGCSTRVAGVSRRRSCRSRSSLSRARRRAPSAVAAPARARRCSTATTRSTRRWCSAPATTSRKNGFTDVVIGLSGGIDSSLVAVIAADALGAEHVHGVSMPSRYSSDHSRTDAEQLADEPRHRLPHDRDRARATPRFLEMLAPVVRRPRARPDRGEPAEPHPRAAADGAVEQVRLARAHHRQQERDGGRLLHALRRHRRRLRRHQGRAQAAGLRAVPRAQRAGRAPSSSPRPCSPSRRRPSCAPTSATTRACRPTRCSTRSSRPYVEERPHRRPSSSRPASTPTLVRRIARLVDLAEYKRRQTPAGRAGHRQGVRQGPPPAHHQRLPGHGVGRGRRRSAVRRGPVRPLRRGHRLGVRARWSRCSVTSFAYDEALELMLGSYHEDTDHPWHQAERGELAMADWFAHDRPAR